MQKHPSTLPSHFFSGSRQVGSHPPKQVLHISFTPLQFFGGSEIRRESNVNIRAVVDLFQSTPILTRAFFDISTHVLANALSIFSHVSWFAEASCRAGFTHWVWKIACAFASAMAPLKRFVFAFAYSFR